MARREPTHVRALLVRLVTDLRLTEGIERAQKQMAWEQLVRQRVPIAAGSRVVAQEGDTLVVSAADSGVAQELRLRQAELLAAYDPAFRQLRTVVGR